MAAVRARLGGTLGRANASARVGAQGTLGGKPQGVGARPGSSPMQIGDAGYLWVLIALEMLATVILRRQTRRFHGG